MTGVDHRFDRPEQRRGIAGGECVDGLIDQCHVGGPEQPQCPLIGDVVAVGAGEQLIKNRQCVPGRTAPGPDHQRVHRVVDDDALLRADPFDQARMVRGGSSRNG